MLVGRWNATNAQVQLYHVYVSIIVGMSDSFFLTSAHYGGVYYVQVVRAVSATYRQTIVYVYYVELQERMIHSWSGTY